MKIILTVTFLFYTIILQAQANSYLTDLAVLKSILQKTPSYKAQIRGDRLSAYNSLYHRLAADTINLDDYKYFFNLSQLIFPLRDNHLGFYQLPNYAHFKTKESIDEYTKTKAFSDYPKSNINIDSLKVQLAKKPKESVEGIYHYDKFYSVGLFKSGDKEYTGVILDSEIKQWPRGQIVIHLYESEPNLYKAIYGHPATKHFILQNNEKYKYQSLINSYFYASYSQGIYSRKQQQADYVNLPRNDVRFEFKNISNDVQYLLIKSFQADNITAQKSARFYDSIKNSLTAPNVIVDLRNNEGGAEKQMKKYLKLLQQYAKKNNIYVLINNGTLSQAEIFTLQLKNLKNITLIGQTTKGMLTYGSNYGKRVKLPSQKFEIYITDMKTKPEHLLYEDYGIKPDIELSDEKNWIEQVIEIIKSR